ncbi:MAG: hypothetical protein A2X25_02555 [Chloroflexi bacterium GWB2_49_20]|nr:MAG: hypothetical protein A2X25_02555 [Chloroflexi bacterium GWB2_49_20]OGN79734.1 MAG: hypothetical protein A2X26_07535 [Chloroflexi bacterium GWC2_49_37]OGN85982.1 MAG: hypothetical protein A2X27_00295 [Chloroflexi bacterium GWD2_49_16]HBG73956.1 hypothetical protein [Anaerolineae bacterium]HCC78778.1 hypothetical protein [Anaerolineae bacterium]
MIKNTKNKKKTQLNPQNTSTNTHQQNQPLILDEETLRAGEIRFHTLSENSLTGIYIIQDGKLSYVNLTFAKIFGYVPGELIGTDPLLLIDPVDQNLVADKMHCRISNEIVTTPNEFRVKCKNGENKQIEVWGSWSVLDDSPALIGNIVDITDRKKGAIMLSESEKIFQNLFENAPIGILHSLPEGRFLRVNSTFAHMLGYGSPEELVAMITNISTQIYVDGDKRSDDLAGILNSNGWYSTENRYRCKDGIILNIKLTARKVLNLDGTIAYFEGFVEDITERKRDRFLVSD